MATSLIQASLVNLRDKLPHTDDDRSYLATTPGSVSASS